MATDAASIVINGAPSQYDRWLRALDAGYAPVDGRTVAELLDFAVRYGGLVNFYNLRDEVDGDWTLFFLTDPTMLLAAIDATDLSAVAAEFARLERLTAAARDFALKFDRLRQTFAFILDLARRLDLYYKLPLTGATADQLEHLLGEMIRRDLSEQLRALEAYDEGAGLPGALGRPVGLDYSGFAPVWNLRHVCPDAAIYRGRTDDRKIDHALPRLNPIFGAFLHALSDLQRFARANLTDTLGGGSHKPHVALYMAFVELFRTAQQTINTISGRYVNFYYRDILRARHRGPVADSVYLTFTLAAEEGVLSAPVPRGTLFPAGQDGNDRDILYAADRDLVVTSAAVAKLHTLRVVSGSLYEAEAASPPSPSSPPDAHVVRRVMSSNIATDEAEAEGTAAAPAPAGWATFGAALESKTDVEVTEPATLGFAIASAYLMLTGGRRQVTLEVGYPLAFQQDVLAPLLAQLADASGLSAEEVLPCVLAESFTLYVSTAAGWLRVESYNVAATTTPGAGYPSFSLCFELPPSAPAVVPYDPEGADATEEDETAAASVSDEPHVNASNPASALPTLKVYLRQDAARLGDGEGAVYVYPLSLLSGMEVTGFRLGVKVSDLSDLQLENTDGEVDASALFYPFGGSPALGSYLRIRNQELFVKEIDSLEIAVNWFNLPTNTDGFKGYYKYYVIGPNGRREPNLFDNQVFRARFGVEQPGLWSLGWLAPASPPPPGDDAYMFRTLPDCADPVPSPAGTLCPDSLYQLNVYPATVPPYYDPAASAVKLELTAPTYAFGNSLYSQNVLNAVIEDLPDPARCQEQCAAECRPLADARLCVDSCVACLLECEGIAGGEYAACAESCVERCLGCLLDVAAACVESCLGADSVPHGAPALPSAAPRAETLLGLPADERARVVRQYADGLRRAWGAASPPADACLEKCLTLFESILCVMACAGGPGSPPAALKECLAACGARLREAHEKCVERCMAECTSLKNELKYPNEPYLPQATKLTVNYSAACAFAPAATADACGQFFHLLPFGGYCPVDAPAPEPPPLLPSFTYPGNLYIGFAGLVPPQTLTLLFQMTGDAAETWPTELPPVVWEYLSGNRWTRLPKSQVRLDTTDGLRQTGIVALALPAYDPAGNTICAADAQWLRASVEGQAGRFPRCVSIYPHALTATWQDHDNTGEHLTRPLPPHTIDGSIEDLPDIAAIDQPIESFGGRPPETARAFETRVGERLRHKERAILSWDYERLVLERFPTVWKAQALPARNPRQGDAPGDVLVVVVSGPDSVQTVDPTAPLLTGAALAGIQTYLERRASPFVRLSVVNPVYVRIEVSVSVRFSAEATQGASAAELDAELVRYLSPWFYDAARAARGGRYVSESDISEFIQTRPYVEAMDSIAFRYEPEPAKLDWYFLTSARQHRIHDAGAVVPNTSSGY